MGRTHVLAPAKKQDKLEDYLLKTKDGSYLDLCKVRIILYGESGFHSNTSRASEEQDRLDEGLIKFNNDSYRPVDNIYEVEENDCFVATAVYGDAHAPQVEALREFRDNVLQQSTLGRAIVTFYYSGAGKKAADFIKENVPSTIPAIRSGLDYLVEKYSAKRK